ncbi:dna-pol [Catopsilia pomona nucleopolyhedrovirus]|uniref:DNA polymerase n=1 Tax=Catopsilia pomona nucleopolyhedrovirus TaxID=1850906 RepID=A0A172WZF2_9ABAC|nr:dna-pol [Catopsilia pomona nucleopolyhedrovirus]ANF29723.1 dna-pol [Catopsilia pomona nucleopolyhedrovirus]
MKIYTYNQLKNELADYCRPNAYTLTPNDPFRIIRLVYDERAGNLLVFCNVNIEHGVLQFYFKVKLNLYSYKQCYNKHIFPTCRNKCTSYVTFIAPGLKGYHLDKINVIKYKRNEASHTDNSKCLDKFLHNVNRVHMQTPFVEGLYMRFKRAQQCRDNYVGTTSRLFNLDRFDEDFEIVDEMQLTTNIMPVLSCYDIETYSDGQSTSKASVDFIISIAMVVYKDNAYLKICLMYHKDNDVVVNMANDDNCNDKDMYAIVFNNELDMIHAFFELIQITNPDVVLDFNGDMFDLAYIRERLKKTKMQLKRYDLPATPLTIKLFYDKLGNKVDTYYFNYYIHIDLYKLFSTDSNQNKVENFALNTISNYFLNESKIDLHWTEMVKMYNSKRLGVIAQYNVQDCMLPVKLFVKLKLTDNMYTQCILHRLCTDDIICNVSHLISVAYFFKGLTNTRASNEPGGKLEPNPYFLNKNDLSTISGQFKNKNGGGSSGGISQLNRKLIPFERIPKTAIDLGPANQIVKYKGGKVLQPRAGIYKHAFSLDFNSLYLTIMIDICACLSNLMLCENGNVYLNQDKNAINVKLLMELLEQRRKFKKTRDNQSTSEFLYDLYDQMQNSVKRTANSIYGYYGIFYKALANYITKVGRRQLRTAICLIESLSNNAELLEKFNLTYINFKVIYGDTDSTFVLPTFNYDEIAENVKNEKLKEICAYVENCVNATFKGGYKMAFENLMDVLILLKKKKYCYLNSENKITFKGWLVKKDMPVFMRATFRLAIEQILRHMDLNKCLQCLIKNFTMYYNEFNKSKPLTDYSFSMTYNDNVSKKRKIKDGDGNEDDNDDNHPPPAKRRVVTVARHCREILINKGADFVPGNGDRIPYLLIDIEGKVTEKAYPLRLFDPSKMRISWMKHMGILCTFMNELLEIYGDEHRDKIDKCFKTIVKTYMQNQLYDKKEPMLVKISEKKLVTGQKRKRTTTIVEKNNGDDNDTDDDNSDDNASNLSSDDDDDNDCVSTGNNTYKFCLYKMRK